MAKLKAFLSVVGAPAIFRSPCVDANASTPLAIVDFDYNDTSGEPAGQRALHQARLAAFMQAIRSDLADSGKISLVALSC